VVPANLQAISANSQGRAMAVQGEGKQQWL
jgi:hypothetical protein